MWWREHECNLCVTKGYNHPADSCSHHSKAPLMTETRRLGCKHGICWWIICKRGRRGGLGVRACMGVTTCHTIEGYFVLWSLICSDHAPTNAYMCFNVIASYRSNRLGWGREHWLRSRAVGNCMASMAACGSTGHMRATHDPSPHPGLKLGTCYARMGGNIFTFREARKAVCSEWAHAAGPAAVGRGLCAPCLLRGTRNAFKPCCLFAKFQRYAAA